MLVRAKKSRWHVRCSKEKCKMRAFFPKHPDEYDPPRKCRGCGGTKFRVIKNRQREAGIKDRYCTCAGYKDWGDDRTASRPPHTKGSPLCWYRADGTMRCPGDDDFNDPNYEPPSTEQENIATDG